MENGSDGSQWCSYGGTAATERRGAATGPSAARKPAGSRSRNHREVWAAARRPAGSPSKELEKQRWVDEEINGLLGSGKATGRFRILKPMVKTPRPGSLSHGGESSSASRTGGSMSRPQSHPRALISSGGSLSRPRCPFVAATDHTANRGSRSRPVNRGRGSQYRPVSRM